jgi:hypothetical protein
MVTPNDFDTTRRVIIAVCSYFDIKNIQLAGLPSLFTGKLNYSRIRMIPPGEP